MGILQEGKEHEDATSPAYGNTHHRGQQKLSWKDPLSGTRLWRMEKREQSTVNLHLTK
ncbi:hypothetical protein RvY_04439 [Ramazzottius varieornatus]|uniref:Uncharacterized protein n=1 Tax=Ramazzottius varieornatus TaxID=947166 RepID=A0A1D1URL9_RAMVA|nr:hypothetical protein RvY_04439 [Ramazzottius varieornatus]